MLKVHSSTKHTPFELVFGQPPRSVVVPDARLKELINEEDLELNVPTGEMESAQDTSDVVCTTVELTLQHKSATTIQHSSPSIHDSIHDSSPTVLDTIQHSSHPSMIASMTVLQLCLILITTVPHLSKKACLTVHKL
eukprot:Em0001g1341a